MNPVKSPTKKSTQKAAKGLSAEEKAPLKERLKEEKAEREGKAAESDVLAAIAAMKEPDRSMAKRIHAIIKDPRQPCYKPGMGCRRMRTRRARSSVSSRPHENLIQVLNVGFDNRANLDEGALWPVAFALKE